MQSLLDLKTLSRIKDLPLVAKTIAEGFLHGYHQSKQRGVGIEFSQYRVYEPGDELSRIDWKLFARSDKYFVREAERESEISIWFVVDCSASMAFSSESDSGQNWSKLDYARHLIATLGYLAQSQGDGIGLMPIGANPQAMFPIGSGQKHWQKMLQKLVNIKATDAFADLSKISKTVAQLQRPGLVVLISDFYQRENEILDFVQQLGVGGNEVIAMQLQSHDEINFPYKGAVRFEDLETGEQVLLSASSAKRAYQQARQEYQSALQASLLKLSMPLHQFDIDKPLDQAMYEFLRHRNRVVR